MGRVVYDVGDTFEALNPEAGSSTARRSRLHNILDEQT